MSFVSHKENLWLKGGVLKYPIKTSALDAAGGGRVAIGGGCWLAPGVQKTLPFHRLEKPKPSRGELDAFLMEYFPV